MAVDESRAESFSALVGECRERSRQYRLERPVTGGFFEAAEGFEAGGVRIEGVLFKKSRFYSRVRMGKHIWQKRYFVLYDNRELHYFEGQSMESIQRKGRIRMGEAQSIARTKPGDKKDFTFCIREKGRDWILDAGTEQAMDEWLAKLKPMLK